MGDAVFLRCSGGGNEVKARGLVLEVNRDSVVLAVDPAAASNKALVQLHSEHKTRCAFSCCEEIAAAAVLNMWLMHWFYVGFLFGFTMASTSTSRMTRHMTT